MKQDKDISMTVRKKRPGKKKRLTAPKSTINHLSGDIQIKRGGELHPLSEKDEKALIQMLAIKTGPSVDHRNLAPAGSILDRVVRHFAKTDIPNMLPLMQVVMIASSYLTQNGAYLEIKGVGQIRPILWNICLADSGSSKTLATNEVLKIFSADGEPPVRLLPTGSTDAQWILDLKENNGAFWLQDEVGKYFKLINTSGNYARLKNYILNAYSHETISNRLKSEENKCEIVDPHFTFLGLSVPSTWKTDIDLTSMLDGFCQRYNYAFVEPRRDRDTYSQFLYFTENGVEQRRIDLGELWQALCGQPGATEPYSLAPGILEYLENWWRGLRDTWGNTPVPGSFVRRIGFSIIRYLVVLHFLLGKSRWPIDLETAELATRYAELHFLSILAIIRDYDSDASNRVAKIANVREQLSAAGKPVTAREVSRRLSKAQREMFTKEQIQTILNVLEGASSSDKLFEDEDAPEEKSAALIGKHEQVLDRARLNERKRNERRLRNLRNAFRASSAQHNNVVSNTERLDDRQKDGREDGVTRIDEWRKRDTG